MDNIYALEGRGVGADNMRSETMTDVNFRYVTEQ